MIDSCRATPRRGTAAVVAATLAALLTAGCSTNPSAEEQQLAETLVSSAHEAGIAPRLTVDVAESLYGTDAPTVCDAFEGGTSTSGELLLFGNQTQRRRKTITDDATAFARLVVETYCPDVLPDFDEAVERVDPIERDR
jgi:hypothetical protein